MKPYFLIILIGLFIVSSLKADSADFGSEPVFGNVKVDDKECLIIAYSIGLKVTGLGVQIRERAASAGAMPLPIYPSGLLRAMVTGKSEVQFDLQKDGSLANIRLGSSTNEALGEACIAAVKQWKFDPLQQVGKAKVVAAKATFVFSIYSD